MLPFTISFKKFTKFIMKNQNSMLFIYFIVLLPICYGVESDRDNSQLCFPKGFRFGAATAAFQIEGAWNVSGKGESMWDRYTHQYPERVFDHSNADVAADSYRLYREDVSLAKQLGVQFYRFSISWPRVLPSGFSNYINSDGIRYYDALIEELLHNNIQPLVTMYHWDLPQSLQDFGGWSNPVMADYFVDYARVLFDRFGDRVTTWLTFNEPLTFCLQGYGGKDAPGGFANGTQSYMCTHNVLRAHGMVYRMYDREYRPKQAGQIGIALNCPWIEPNSNDTLDLAAAETARQFMFGWHAHPILSEQGDYPPIMRSRIDDISKRQNYPRSRLPYFTRTEIEVIRGSYDFLGYNHYTTQAVKHGSDKINPKAVPTFTDDMGVVQVPRPDWPPSNSTWLQVVPWGFRKMMNWIKDTYKNPVVMITENGVSMEPGVEDPGRVGYIDSYLRNLHAAIVQDGCNVVAYTYWSLIDNYEWMRGFSERFGVYAVDYKSENRTRTARSSAKYYGKIASTGCLPSLNGSVGHETGVPPHTGYNVPVAILT